MTRPRYLIKQCSESACRFRFPAAMEANMVLHCPRCGTPNLQEAESFENLPVRSSDTLFSAIRLYGMMDNLRSAYNVGSIFRTASGAGLLHLYLCGITPTPKHPGVSKTSLGAEELTPWSHHNNALDLALELQEHGHLLVALENRPSARWLFEMAPMTKAEEITLIVGNELSGVDPAIIRACDHLLALPMLGNKSSLNVTVAFGVAAYFLHFLGESAPAEPIQP